MTELAEKLYNTGDLSDSELKALIETDDSETAELLRRYADETRQKSYGKKVFLRGLIEVSSYCRNDCLYCGIRRSNKEADRYRLSREEIMSCCENGYGLGFRTFVMQGGEDSFFTDDFMCSVISEIKAKNPDLQALYLPRSCLSSNCSFPFICLITQKRRTNTTINIMRDPMLLIILPPKCNDQFHLHYICM